MYYMYVCCPLVMQFFLRSPSANQQPSLPPSLPPALVLLSAHADRVSVSRMRDMCPLHFSVIVAASVHKTRLGGAEKLCCGHDNDFNTYIHCQQSVLQDEVKSVMHHGTGALQGFSFSH